ncbi:MAG: rhodanese-like domain-containing protein [Actinomycetes bacterium]
MSLFSKLFVGGTGTAKAVGPAEAHELARSGAFLVDVRERHEYAAGHAPGSVHIPLGELSTRLSRIPQGKTVLTVCRSGARSARAARLLRGAGYTVINVRGGMSAWAAAGLPVQAKNGRPGQIG